MQLDVARRLLQQDILRATAVHMSFNPKIRQGGIQARQARAVARAADLAAVINELHYAG
jgi:hypothetical protein